MNDWICAHCGGLNCTHFLGCPTLTEPSYPVPYSVVKSWAGGYLVATKDITTMQYRTVQTIYAQDAYDAHCIALAMFSGSCFEVYPQRSVPSELWALAEGNDYKADVAAGDIPIDQPQPVPPEKSAFNKGLDAFLKYLGRTK